MRQDSIESHRLMLELRARTDQQLEQQKTLEKLQATNAMLEQSQVGVLVFYMLKSFWQFLLTQCFYSKRFGCTCSLFYIFATTWRLLCCSDIVVIIYTSGSTDNNYGTASHICVVG